MDVRPYDAASPTEADALWDLKQAFERGLGAGTGGEEKQATYEAKLTDEYRERYLDWVERCLDSDERCVTVAAPGDESSGYDDESNETSDGRDGALAGYVFVLPESMAMIWDAAVLNEIYVAPEYRGTGLADDLMDAALALARDQDLPLDRLVLDVDPDNERARAFYRRHGFESWGELVAREV